MSIEINHYENICGQFGSEEIGSLVFILYTKECSRFFFVRESKQQPIIHNLK